jgi:regulator of nonsense transcripts 2
MPLARAKLQRHAYSITSERAPLSTVPTLMLPESDEPLLMGRSSASCHHQLSANRLISRVHVKATYKPAGNPFDRSRVEIVCTGWNGIKLHCQGKTYDLGKGKMFTCDIKDADIMIDVHDARVLIQWPRHERKESTSADSDQAWEENSPRRVPQSLRGIPDSPFREQPRLVSPISPSPAARAMMSPSSPLLTPSRSQNPVVVYEDEPSPTQENVKADKIADSTSTQAATQGLNSSQQSALSELSQSYEEFSDHDEENDPIIHSFGPFGENLLPRMASFRAGDSPVQTPRSARANAHAEPLKPTKTPPQLSVERPVAESKEEEGEVDEQRTMAIESIRNHAINQLAFSRLASTPFSIILNNLPLGLWKDEATSEEKFSPRELRSLLEGTKCIGEVAREGKDAAGKPLESEFYYVPDLDDDEMRRQAVVNDLRKPGLRNCRKQHKVSHFCTVLSAVCFTNVNQQYFWRKPK